MHIPDGMLPVEHAAGWWMASAPFLAHGLYRAGRTLKNDPEAKLLMGASGGFAFVLSAVKLPSFSGSCSHATGIGLGTILFGPSIMTVLGFIVLLFQALLLGHGGLSSLGANVFSMAVVGSWVTLLVFRVGRALRVPFAVSVFLGAALGDLATYGVTAVQIAWARPDVVTGFAGQLVELLMLFAITQIPLAISEGLLTVITINLLLAYNPSQLGGLLRLPGEKPTHDEA